jgi:hypothetical protein
VAEVVQAQVGRKATIQATSRTAEFVCIALAIWTLHGCAPAEDDPPPASSSETAKTATKETQDPTPTPKSAKEAVEQVLKRCHGILMSAEDMANSAIKLRRSADDTVPEQVKLGAEDCIKITLRDRTKKVLTATGHAWHVFPYETPVVCEPIEGKKLARFRRFQQLLRTALLEPLYKFEKAKRQGPNIYALTLPFGETWQLELREVKTPKGKIVLLPYELSGPPGKVVFGKHLHTGVTHLPKKVMLGEFGLRWFALELTGLTFGESVFADPRKARNKEVIVPTRWSPDPPIGDVGFKTVAAKTALVLVDPGNWESRFELAKKNSAELGGQGQMGADEIDFLFDEGGKRYIAMVFTEAPKNIGGKPFVAKKHQRILKLPQQRVAIVYPKHGSLEACEKVAEKLLSAFIAENKLEVTGAMRITPWVFFDKALPSKRELNHLRIGFEIPVR